jgi:hypothetical protein
MTDGAPLPTSAWDFLPDNLQQDDEKNQLYPWLAPLIDWALPPITDIEQYTLDPLAVALGIEYASVEAYAAWFNVGIKPIVGTKPAIEFAMKLMGIEGARIIEWYEDTVETMPKFKFIIEFDNFPSVTEFGPFVDLVYQLKNERSWLVSIRMKGCDDRLRDVFAGVIPIQDVDGYRPDLGIIVCLFQLHAKRQDLAGQINFGVMASRYSVDIPYRGLPLLQIDQVDGADVLERDFYVTGQPGDEIAILWT